MDRVKDAGMQGCRDRWSGRDEVWERGLEPGGVKQCQDTPME